MMERQQHANLKDKVRNELRELLIIILRAVGAEAAAGAAQVFRTLVLENGFVVIGG